MKDSTLSQAADNAGAKLTTQGIPRWLKVLGLVVLVLMAVFVLMHLTGNSLGGHMPIHDYSSMPGMGGK